MGKHSCITISSYGIDDNNRWVFDFHKEVFHPPVPSQCQETVWNNSACKQVMTNSWQKIFWTFEAQKSLQNKQTLYRMTKCNDTNYQHLSHFADVHTTFNQQATLQSKA